MKERRAILPVAGLALVPLLLLAAGLLSRIDYEWVPIVVLGVWLVSTAAVGGLVYLNRRAKAVGPLMIGATLLVTLGLFVETYASYVFELNHRSFPLGSFAAWLTLWLTIPGFGLFIHLRDQVNLDAMTDELVNVVARTMQPQHASLWLRTGSAR